MNIRIELDANEMAEAIASAMRAKMQAQDINLPVDPKEIIIIGDGGTLETRCEGAFVTIQVNIVVPHKPE